MYNDYYLQEISTKITTTNNRLADIIENQEAIITNQQQTYSGDIETRELIRQTNSINVAITMVLAITLLYTFVKGCFRC